MRRGHANGAAASGASRPPPRKTRVRVPESRTLPARNDPRLSLNWPGRLEPLIGAT